MLSSFPLVTKNLITRKDERPSQGERAKREKPKAGSLLSKCWLVYFVGSQGPPLSIFFHLNNHPHALPPFLLTAFWNKKLLPSTEPAFVSPAFLHSYNPRCTSTIPQRFSGVSTISQFRPETGESSLEHVLILQKSPQMGFKYLC